MPNASAVDCAGEANSLRRPQWKKWLEERSILCMTRSGFSAQVYDSDFVADELPSGYMVRGDSHGFGQPHSTKMVCVAAWFREHP